VLIVRAAFPFFFGIATKKSPQKKCIAPDINDKSIRGLLTGFWARNENHRIFFNEGVDVLEL
ncbi:MAG: hypothetical protein KDC37_01280, partial [Flavobacteriales bacterium]|nr:hypothetical protein [Flavobacteriales bacterium]